MNIPLIQLKDILAARPIDSSTPLPDISCTGITTDSRSVDPGNVFLALRGDKFDGHAFVESARKHGAIAAIVDYPIPASIPQLLVNNTLKAYQDMGNWWRDRFQIPIVGITGSVGKTTTKELIAAVLSTQGSVLKTEANYNNEIGVPKTLLGLTQAHDYAVIEMAMRGRGQIAELTQIARPDIGVITNVGTAHIGLLGSEEAIAEAKCELLAHMPKTSVAILNADNPLLMETAKRIWSDKQISYGLENGDFRGRLLDANTLEVEGKKFPLPLPGRHHALNYLAALAVAKVLDIDWSSLTEGLSVNLPSGRAQRYDLANDIAILDETYNAGLESMLASLQLLADTPGNRRIAVLGTMKELGERSPEFHKKVGTAVRDLNLDALFILADSLEAEAMALGAQGVPHIEIEDLALANAHDRLANRLKGFMRSGDRVLFKASHSVQLDRVVAQLKSER
jgi:UDP-N-acetylmuramoyl-tripeptide--D-alanyl-D-alanine ligase